MLVRIAQVLLFVGAATTLGFMGYAGEPTSALWWLLSLPFAAWTLLPYALVASEARRHASNRGSLSLLGLAAALLSGSSIVLLYLAFVAQPDAQSGLVLVFLPLWQLVAMLPFLGVSRLLARPGAAV
jgi:SNF family Na+-dependent transporter